ncbi:hypothetical protein HYDPIDRAFT_29827 [Hydnomerulius pinastri MD-312]|uniref:Unplaced genomic scaffold scaffold_18, whole genome shotgun sequence n=1 Tax=Hydnomerulius pinastri MD-312 TaxID=994086 RepID=A0A0C9WDL4_9AGAM|nr:hypothetical protein HYDPIDRAFT_29827 [Hydnomerulius pinastri MD-312]
MATPQASNDEGSGAILLDEFCEWYETLDDISELPVPRVIREAQNFFDSVPWPSLKHLDPSDFYCQSVHLYDQTSRRHLWISRALSSENRPVLELRYVASPPVVIASWDDTTEHPQPSWVSRRQGKVARCIQPNWEVIPHYTAHAQDHDNAAKKLAIFRWCAGVEPDLHYWGLMASSWQPQATETD